MPDFFSRDELLGGLPARRASTLLFAIESRTAQLALRNRQVGARYLTEHSAAEQERQFLNALAQARENNNLVKIQDIERYAPQWASLVPAESGVRAAIAQLLGSKYRFRKTDVPDLRLALGLDTNEVQQGFQKFYNKPLASIYQTTFTRRERLAWWRAKLAQRLEALPPFWTAFALTLTETVGAGILALPIGFAQLGAWGGILVLVLVGIINCLTIAAFAEAVVRNGNMRYGTHYFGSLIQDFLGTPGVVVMTVTLTLLDALCLLAYFLGVAKTLEGATTISPLLWAGLLFLVLVFFIKRGSIEATAASALVIGFINIVLILVLAGLALPHLNPQYLMQLNLSGGGEGLNLQAWGIIVGIVLTAYYGHTSAGNAAKVVLRRDPSGRALIFGNVAALGTACVLYALWVLAVNGSVSPAALTANVGTALVPLASQVGISVYVFGTVFVVLAMGMGSIHVALALFFAARERLPRRGESGKGARGARAIWNSQTARFLIAAAPVIGIFLVAEWFLTGAQHAFTDVLGIIGLIADPILAGIIPMWLLVASRRKGDYLAGGAWAWLGNPILVGLLYLGFLAFFFIQGLYVFPDLPSRLFTLAIGMAMIATTFILWRRGAFNSREVLEFRLDTEQPEAASFNLVANGQPMVSQVELQYANQTKTLHAAQGAVPDYRALKTAHFNLEPAPVQELKIWAHAITPEGDSEPLPLTVKIDGRGEPIQFRAGQESAIISIAAKPVQVHLEIHPSKA